MSNKNYKATLIKSIQREWDALMAVVKQLSPEQMVTPDAGGWTPKDNLGHLTQWMKALLGYHIDHKSGQEVLGIPKELDENFDFQKVNEFMVERDRDRSIEVVLAELKEEYARVIARLEAMPFEELLKPRYEDDPRQTPLLSFVLGDTSEHFQEHRETIEKLL